MRLRDLHKKRFYNYVNIKSFSSWTTDLTCKQEEQLLSGVYVIKTDQIGKHKKIISALM